MKINNILKFIGILLLLSFIFLIIASKSGYYEYQLSNKRIMTEEAIERFEKDVSDGKYIDLNKYIDTNSKDYNNKISNIGNNLSNTISSIVSKGFSYLFDYLNKQIER